MSRTIRFRPTEKRRAENKDSKKKTAYKRDHTHNWEKQEF